MRIGINASALLTQPTMEDLISHAKQTEADGFSSWWLAQTGMIDALTVFVAASGATASIEMGSAVIPTFIRHPQTLAAQAISAAAVLGDRLVLGVGLSHQPVVEDRWGMKFERPIRHALDYLTVLNNLIETGKVAHDGDIFTSHGEYPLPPAPKPSVMFAALGPQMLRVAAKRTDGTILWMVGPKTVANHIAPTFTQAAAEAGRPAPRIVTGLPVLVTDDEAAGRAMCDKMFALYGQLPSYRAMLDREGVKGPGEVCVVGNEDSVRAQLQAHADSGTTDFAAVEIGGPDEVARTRALLMDVQSGGT